MIPIWLVHSCRWAYEIASGRSFPTPPFPIFLRLYHESRKKIGKQHMSSDVLYSYQLAVWILKCLNKCSIMHVESLIVIHYTWTYAPDFRQLCTGLVMRASMEGTKLVEQPHPNWKPGEKQPHPFPDNETIELDPQDYGKKLYPFMISSVVPRPIAFISSMSKQVKSRFWY